MAEAPIAVWLHIGPASQATVSVSFIGTYRTMTLTRVQARRLHHALTLANLHLARDDGERQTRLSIQLDQGVDA